MNNDLTRKFARLSFLSTRIGKRFTELQDMLEAYAALSAEIDSRRDELTPAQLEIIENMVPQLRKIIAAFNAAIENNG